MDDKPKTEKRYKTHRFTTRTKWLGGRKWNIFNESGFEAPGGPPPVFNGEAERWSPEDLLLASVNSCHLASFVSYCMHKNFEFLAYESTIEGILEHDGQSYRFTKMIIRPHVTVKSEEDIDTVRQYLQRAHEMCFMGRSVNAEILLEPEIIAG